MSLQTDIEISITRARIYVQSYPQVAARQRELYEAAGLGGDPEFPDPYDEALEDIGKLIAAARVACREIKALKKHAHDWNGNDYCSICGADGRA